MALTLTQMLRENLELEVEVSVFTDFPTVGAFRKHLAEFTQPIATSVESDLSEDQSSEQYLNLAARSTSDPPRPAAHSLYDQVLEIVAEELEIDCSEFLEDDVRWADHGLDSLMSSTLTEKLRKNLKLDLEIDFFIQCETVGAVRECLPDLPAPESAGHGMISLRLRDDASTLVKIADVAIPVSSHSISVGTAIPPRARLPPRSRTGCWTCRTRKVKCDEGRPVCGQCSRLEHNCDYSLRLSSAPVKIANVAIPVPSDSMEKQREKIDNFYESLGSSPCSATSIEHEQYLPNPKQRERILKRRVAKQNLGQSKNRSRRPYLHEARHNHTMRRPRGPDGRFLTSDEIVAMPTAEPSQYEKPDTTGAAQTHTIVDKSPSITGLSRSASFDGGFSPDSTQFQLHDSYNSDDSKAYVSYGGKYDVNAGAGSGSRSRSRLKSRSRSTSSERHNSTGRPPPGAAALAAAAAIAARRKARAASEDRERSRSRRRRSRSLDDSQSRIVRTAQAGIAGAAVASLVERARSKSRGRTDRSRSRIRRPMPVPVAAAGLGTAALAGLYEKNKAKREQALLDEVGVRSQSPPRDRSRSPASLDDPSLISYCDGRPTEVLPPEMIAEPVPVLESQDAASPESEISTHPSVIQGPIAGYDDGTRDHWPYAPTPPPTKADVLFGNTRNVALTGPPDLIPEALSIDHAPVPMPEEETPRGPNHIMESPLFEAYVPLPKRLPTKEEQERSSSSEAGDRNKGGRRRKPKIIHGPHPEDEYAYPIIESLDSGQSPHERDTGVFSIEGSPRARQYVDEHGRPTLPPSYDQGHRDGAQHASQTLQGAEIAALDEDFRDALEALRREMADVIHEQRPEIDYYEKSHKKLERNMEKPKVDRARSVERLRISYQEALEKKLAEQAKDLKHREQDSKNFQESLMRREAAEPLDRAEEARLGSTLELPLPVYPAPRSDTSELEPLNNIEPIKPTYEVVETPPPIATRGSSLELSENEEGEAPWEKGTMNYEKGDFVLIRQLGPNNLHAASIAPKRYLDSDTRTQETDHPREKRPLKWDRARSAPNSPMSRSARAPRVVHEERRLGVTKAPRSQEASASAQATSDRFVKTDPRRDYYADLELSWNADTEHIKKQFRVLGKIIMT